MAAFLAEKAKPAPRPELWKEVDVAVNKGLPKDAVKKLVPIIESATEEGAYAEAIRAIGKKIAIEGVIQGNKPEEKIIRMKEAIGEAKEEMKPAMEAILAHWFWHYFQQNRWRFMQRTATSESPSDDFTTWDLARILAEIDKQFQAALAHDKTLKAIPIADYDAMLQKGSAPDTFRPTLYDFVAHEALRFYQAGEQAGSRHMDEFYIEAESPAFGTAKEFIAWDPDTKDETSPTLRAIRIFQSLLHFHNDDDDRSALLDADLLRLNFANNKATGDNKEDRYIAALSNLVKTYPDHRITARAYHDWAQVVHNQGDYVKARELAKTGADNFSNTPGGNRCHNLLISIEAKSYHPQVEQVWNDPWPAITMRYRNIGQIHFRAVKADYVDEIQKMRRLPQWLEDNHKRRLLGMPVAKSWSEELKTTPDYQEQLAKLDAPRDLAPGFYYLLASPEKNFTQKDNQIYWTTFWVSDLSIVTRTQNGLGNLEGFVLKAQTGEPVQDSKVTFYRQEGNGFKAGPAVFTDKEGFFRSDNLPRGSYFQIAEYKGDQLGNGNQLYINNYHNRQRPYERIIFFTDRSLYRPGQTIQFKAICIAVDQERNSYKAVPNKPLNVVFRDPNGQEVSKLQLRTNGYGSISGSFTAPRDRLAGQMSIRADGIGGQAFFNVEEYKRPKFDVTLGNPEKPAKLGEEIHLKGKATAYTGAAINDAPAKYRVVREIQYPHWYWWRYWWRPNNTDQQEISRGTVTTKADGTYDIRFTAKPDAKVSLDDEPTFRFTVFVDVTDNTGETRSAQNTVAIGTVPMSASISSPNWITANAQAELSVRTFDSSGTQLEAKGTLKVHRVKEPLRPVRQNLGNYKAPSRRGQLAPEFVPEPDPANARFWETGELVASRPITIGKDGPAKDGFDLGQGLYRAIFTTKDKDGKEVTAQHDFRVLDPSADKYRIKDPFWLDAPSWSVEPGESFEGLWGSGYETARAFVELVYRDKTLQRYWTPRGATQNRIEQGITDEMRGGITLRVTMVRENRAYLRQQQINVPWSNKDLDIQWEHFTDKLQPSARETWTAVIKGKDAQKAAAEMVATLYDESLDAYKPHNWQQHFNVFRSNYTYMQMLYSNKLLGFNWLLGQWDSPSKDPSLDYREFHNEITANLWAYQYRFMDGLAADKLMRKSGVPMPTAAAAPMLAAGNLAMEESAGIAVDAVAGNANGAKPMFKFSRGNNRLQEQKSQQATPQGSGNGEPQSPDLSKVSARTNLNETAFFFPHLISGDDGSVRMEFTMPEALTKWKFMGFAHDASLRAGFLTGSTVTAKDLMVVPNPPRFLREGDELEFTVKVTNLSNDRQFGKVRLTFADARTEGSRDEVLGNLAPDQDFDVPAKESKTYSWRISVPDDLDYLTYKAVAATNKLSDGEAGNLPVLSRRIFVTESLALPIRGPMTKKFGFYKLMQSKKSDTLIHKGYTVQMVSQPAWYAVLALPYLMEFPHECSEQTFNRYYANLLASNIAKSDPKIRRIFDLWKGTPALDSPLEKNESLKSVALLETPWVRQAKNESEARRNIGILFDDNRLDRETSRALNKLKNMQLGDGSWPWFPGGRGNDYLTLYITTGFGRLRHLDVDTDVGPAVKALGRLDNWINKIYRDILRHGGKKANNLSPTIALYLYGRSFFLEDKPVPDHAKEAVDYFLGQAQDHWLDLNNRQSQGHLALATKRFGDEKTAKAIMRSIKQRSVTDPELGRFWRDTEYAYYWYRAPIETQALMIEAFDEVMGDAKAVEDCRVWLIKQKQTQDWKTTKATADAVYGLLLRGKNLLATDKLVAVHLGDTLVEPKDIEPGTGFYEKRFEGAEVRPEFGRITLTKEEEGVSWGSAHWQYMEDISKITVHEGTALKLTKAVFLKKDTDQGPKLFPSEGKAEVGDEMVVRITLQADRDMEYVHMKDHRPSGSEPTNVLSRYQYRDGLAYYESTKDTASHFYFDYLPKGTYVFEYSLRIQHRGKYQTGMANIQCMYAPEFNSHSQSFPLEVE
jgi:5-hydroxyisourate hydrolase-like protein (transthyretin family)